jgi:hypothetical protein
MAKFFCNPYSFELNGFFFTTLEEYQNRLAFAKISQKSVDFENEIELIDGSNIERSIFDLSSQNIEKFYELVESLSELDENQIIVLEHCTNNLGYDFDTIFNHMDSFTIWTDRSDLEDDKQDHVFCSLDIEENDPIYSYFDASRYVEDLLLNDEIIELNVKFYFTNPHFILN